MISSGSLIFEPRTISDSNTSSCIHVITVKQNVVVLDNILKYIVNIFEENIYYVIISISFEKSKLYETTNVYQLSKTSESARKLRPVTSFNAVVNLSKTFIFIQPHNNIYIIFEAPSNIFFQSFLL
jgi:hypothetical protein